MRPVLVLVLAVTALQAAGCVSCPGADEKSAKKAASIVAPDPGHYAERVHGGRIYVFGDPATEAAFDRTPNMQFCRSFIGAGPGGETVVVEVRDKLPELTDRLAAEFAKRHGVRLE